MRKNKYIILALISVCTLYLFEAYFLAPATENYRGSLADQYRKLQRYELLMKGAGTTEAGVKALVDDMKNMEKRLLNEKSDFLASAKMQREISDLSGKTGLSVATVRPLNAVKVYNYSVIPVYFEGNCTIKQLSEFLRLVDAHAFLLKIEKLSINITNMQKPDDLRFKIQVSGLNRV